MMMSKVLKFLKLKLNMRDNVWWIFNSTTKAPYTVFVSQS